MGISSTQNKVRLSYRSGLLSRLEIPSREPGKFRAPAPSTPEGSGDPAGELGLSSSQSLGGFLPFTVMVAAQ